MLAGRTAALLPAVIAAAASNLALNLLMIPRMGISGAAWASVVTFALFAYIGLVRNRRIDRYPYRFATSAVVVSGMSATYVAYRAWVATASVSVQLAVAGVLWVGWAAFLFGGNLKQLRTTKELAPARTGELSRCDDGAANEQAVETALPS
jgi:O-antigen/teichoic acid export membrane protein